jgi:hypothetical protein
MVFGFQVVGNHKFQSHEKDYLPNISWCPGHDEL